MPEDSSNFPGVYAPMGVPLGSAGGGLGYNPYLNIDPSIFKSEPQYIMPEGASPKRGRFELAFSQIGGSVMAGAALGGANGLFIGVRDHHLAKEVWTVRRSKMLTYVTKQGAASASALGVIAVMYSGFGVILSWARGADDELNTLTAGTATGLLFKSSSGLRKCAIGGVVGFGFAAAYCLYASGDRLRQMTKR